MLNRVTLIGNLGRDPEFKEFESGAKVAKFSVATNKSYKVKESDEWKNETTWHNVVAWRHLAEKAQKGLKKGHLVFVEGELTNRKYDDNGETKYVFEIVASVVRKLEKSDRLPSAENAPTEYAKS